MSLEKLTLAERLQRCADDCPAYPEYLPSVIRSFAETPVMEYLAGLPTKKRLRFCELVSLPSESATYQWAAAQIARLPSHLALEAMRILAEPMSRYEAFVCKKEAANHD